MRFNIVPMRFGQADCHMNLRKTAKRNCESHITVWVTKSRHAGGLAGYKGVFSSSSNMSYSKSPEYFTNTAL